jgi:hypothetical protein
MSYRILSGRWCDIIVLNVHVPTEDNIDNVKDSFYDELERYSLIPKIVMYLETDNTTMVFDTSKTIQVFVFQYRMYFATCFDSREPSSGDSFTKAYTYWVMIDGLVSRDRDTQ